MLNKLYTARPLAFAAVVAGLAVSASHGALLYDSDYTQVKSVLTIANNNSIGDDYNTGTAPITIKGLEFYGGVDSSLTNTQVVISFYNSSGAYINSVYPTKSETAGTNAVHYLAASDFNLNGNIGLTVSGSGYVTFQAISFGSFNVNTQVSTPADPNPTVQLGSGVAPTVGTNNGAAAASADSNRVLTTPAVFSVNGVPANQSQYALFSLSDTAVPEPASLTLLGSAALFLARRRRA